MINNQPSEEITDDRKLGRLEGRLDSLETSVENLQNSVDNIISILDFAKKLLKVIYWAIGLIGLDGVINLTKIVYHMYLIHN